MHKVAFRAQNFCSMCRDKNRVKRQHHSDNLILLEKVDKLFIDIIKSGGLTDEEERVTKRIVKKELNSLMSMKRRRNGEYGRGK